MASWLSGPIASLIALNPSTSASTLPRMAPPILFSRSVKNSAMFSRLSLIRVCPFSVIRIKSRITAIAFFRFFVIPCAELPARTSSASERLLVRPFHVWATSLPARAKGSSRLLSSGISVPASFRPRIYSPRSPFTSAKSFGARISCALLTVPVRIASSSVRIWLSGIPRVCMACAPATANLGMSFKAMPACTAGPIMVWTPSTSSCVVAVVSSPRRWISFIMSAAMP